MTINKLLKKFSKKKILIFQEENLEEILKIKNLEVIRDEDTHISDRLRILRINSSIILQEITINHELSLRKLKTLDKANTLVGHSKTEGRLRAES